MATLEASKRDESDALSSSIFDTKGGKSKARGKLIEKKIDFLETLSGKVTSPGQVGVIDSAVELINQRDQEIQREQALVTARRQDFEPRQLAPAAHGPYDPALETAMHASVANIPFPRMVYPRISTYTPCFSSTLYFLNYMDSLMVTTKRWTDNCMGWVPPLSQIFISVLLYIQTIRAMDVAGLLMPGSELSQLLRDFCQYFPLDTMWIPGPLVYAFKTLAPFSPSTTGMFGNVTPALPTYPGWTRARRYSITAPHNTHLPNISYFISRLRSTCTAATRANATEASFANDVDGPHHLSTVFRVPCNNDENERLLVSSPGAVLTYAGSLRMWIDASAFVLSGLPPTLDINAATEIGDSWTQFLRLSINFKWFDPLAHMMARYCQFWKESCPLSECPPTNSAAGAVRCVADQRTDIFNPPEWVAATGGHNHTQHGNANQTAHYNMRATSNLTFRAFTTVQDLPKSNIYAALTYHMNLAPKDAGLPLLAQGPFWDVKPNALARSGIQVYQGIYSTIARDYHSDTQLDADPQ